MIVLIAFTGISIFFLLRSFLIFFGLLKDPILRSFEEYGPEEKLYLPALPLMVWSGALLLLVGLWVAAYPGFAYTLNGVGIILLIAAGLAYNNYDRATYYHSILIRLPRWEHELRQNTTRYERRRIAFMWLYLPRRLRLTYNSSDKLFFLWADFVIMGTVREDEPNTKDEGIYYAGRN